MKNDNVEEEEYIPYFRSDSDIDMKKNVGFFSGISVNIFDNTQINVEKRFSDEDAFEISVLIKF